MIKIRLPSTPTQKKPIPKQFLNLEIHYYIKFGLQPTISPSTFLINFPASFLIILASTNLLISVCKTNAATV